MRGRVSVTPVCSRRIVPLAPRVVPVHALRRLSRLRFRLRRLRAVTAVTLRIPYLSLRMACVLIRNTCFFDIFLIRGIRIHHVGLRLQLPDWDSGSFAQKLAPTGPY